MEPARPAWGSSWQVRHLAGEPSAVIRVRNLQATMAIGRDAWGREHKIQPVLISAEVFLREPFGLAAFADQVSADTVHYGLLSKAILATLESSNASHSIFFVLERVWQRLTGMDFRGCRDSAAFLDISTIRYLSITIHLPKASLLGDGVSMTSSATFRDEAAVRGSVSPLEFVSCSVRLHELRVPTLVGVNDNERSTKQEVVADIEIEKFAHEFDQYSGLESLVVKTMEASSFETLEALGAHIADKITEVYDKRWKIRIRLEKPTAIPLADAACVEITTDGPLRRQEQ